MEILGVIVLLSAIFNLFLGFFVFLKDPAKKINRSFGICGIITAIWIFTNFMMGVRSTIFWLKSTSAFGALVPISAILWVLELCEKKLTKYGIFLLFSLGLFFFIVAYINNFIVANVKRVYLGGFEGEMGPFFIPYWIYIFILLTFILYTLILGYYKATGVRKLQITYVLIGAALYIGVVTIVSFILPLFGILRYAPLDSPSSLFLLFFTALAITRYHLFGIEVILTEILVGVIGLLLIIQIFTAPTILWRIVNSAIFVLFCIGGWLLIRYTFREIKRREEAEKISQAKSEFISITSHQLRTPLSAIKGYLSMVLEGTYGGVPERLKRILENVYISNERMIKLVNAFLDVSRIELGREELKLEENSIEDLISETVSEFEIEAKKKNLYLKFKKPKIPLPKFLFDRDKIKEVISNLIDNAIKYTQEGGITIKLKTQNSKLKIMVEDTGEGLTKEEISKLFESFSRGTAGQKFWTEGVGIGLYISRKFVELHKGKIWAESPGKGKGSAFYIELPMK